MIGLSEIAMVVLERDRQARVILDLTGMLVWANARGLSLLANSQLIELRDDQLAARQVNHRDAFATFITDTSEQMTCSCLPESDGKAHLILRRQPVSFGDWSGSVLTMTHTGEGFEASFPGLQSAFNLTAAEYRILHAMMSGQDVESTAQGHSLSVETVRSHVKSLYFKMTVKSREALFRRAVPFLH